MQIQDKNVPISIEDLLQRYKLGEIEETKNDLIMAKNNLQGELKIVDNELQNFKDATLEKIENLDDQVDGKIMTWFFSGAPTLNNQPAVEWDTIEKKEKHINDLYFDKATGYVYYFANDDGYKWIRNSDQDVVSAMSTANDAKDTADGKRRVFISTPTPPYDKGDLWKNSDGYLYSCKTAKTKNQSYSSSDWETAMSKLQGEVFLNDNTKVIGSTGIYTNLQFTSNRFDICGYEHMAMLEEIRKKPMELHVMIPNNFSITEAKITIYHAPIYWFNYYPTETEGWGYTKNLKLYKNNVGGDFFAIGIADGWFYPPETGSVEISNALGSSGYTPPIPSASNKKMSIYTSNDIKNNLSSGLNLLKIEPSANLTIGSENPGLTALKNSGYCYAVINIFGYQK